MEEIIPTVIQSIIVIVIGGIVGIVSARWQNEKTKAETSRIYQGMALAETAERERLEERFGKEIEALHKNRRALESRLSALKAELDAMKAENIDLKIERDQMQFKLVGQETMIMKLQKRIKELEKKQTGPLKETK